MRLFAAIDIPSAVRTRLAELLDRLRPLAKLHWTPAEKLHVTTKFIGEWPEERLDELTRALRTITEPGPVEVAIRRIGWLPNPRSARILYAGVDATESLTNLAAETERVTQSLGVPAEARIYRPHVTLARTRKTVPLGALKRTLAEIELSDIGHYTTSSFSLYLSADGKYTNLQEFPLLNK